MSARRFHLKRVRAEREGGRKKKQKKKQQKKKNERAGRWGVIDEELSSAGGLLHLLTATVHSNNQELLPKKEIPGRGSPKVVAPQRGILEGLPSISNESIIFFRKL